MAQEVKVFIWCDPCQAEGSNVEGDHIEPVQLPGLRPMALDLCERHAKEVLAPLEELLQQHGQRVGAQAPTPAKRAGRPPGSGSSSWLTEPFICKVPGCASDTEFAAADSLRGHVRSVHGVSTAQYRVGVETGSWPSDASGQSFVCTEPGADGEPCGKDFTDNARPSQALGLHRRAVHGIRGAAA